MNINTRWSSWKSNLTSISGGLGSNPCLVSHYFSQPVTISAVQFPWTDRSTPARGKRLRWSSKAEINFWPYMTWQGLVFSFKYGSIFFIFISTYFKKIKTSDSCMRQCNICPQNSLISYVSSTEYSVPPCGFVRISSVNKLKLRTSLIRDLLRHLSTYWQVMEHIA